VNLDDLMQGPVPEDLTLAEVIACITSLSIDTLGGFVKIGRLIRIRVVNVADECEVSQELLWGEVRQMILAKKVKVVIDDLGGGNEGEGAGVS
jgi:hypothetical protein